MVRRRELAVKSVWDYLQLSEAFQLHGVKLSKVPRVWQYITSCLLDHPERLALLERPCFDGMLDEEFRQLQIPKKAVEILNREFVLSTSLVLEEQRSVSGTQSHKKLLIRMQDGSELESVLIHMMSHQNPLEDYYTICVSSQVGCRMKCSFCATGMLGLQADLTAGEIAEQIYHAWRAGVQPRNLVFMGMGEPLDNYEQVKGALETICSFAGFKIAPGRISLSTVGVIHRIPQVAVDLPKIRLALSLHAPNQKLREEIIPSAKGDRYLERLMESIDKYIEISGNMVMIEYIVLGGVNDSKAIAEELGRLLDGKQVFVNLIPYNPTVAGERFDFEAPSSESLTSMQNILSQFQDHLGRRLRVTIRKSTVAGRDIDAACGQLALVSKQKNSKEPRSLIDIEDIVQSESVKKSSIPIVRKPKKIVEASADTHFRSWMLSPERMLIMFAGLFLLASIALKVLL